MGERKRKYDERTLCPMELPERWWYTLPSSTRRRIREIIGRGPEAPPMLIGAVQDRLVRDGYPTLAARFMRAMQDAHDSREPGAWIPPAISYEYHQPPSQDEWEQAVVEDPSILEDPSNLWRKETEDLRGVPQPPPQSE